VTAELVGDGLRAVARATSDTHFDLILMDCQMPELDGYDATQRIRAWEKESGRARVPILACTAHALPAERARATAIGMDGYLTKPLTLESFRAAVARYSHAGVVAPPRPSLAPGHTSNVETVPPSGAPSLGILAQVGGDAALVTRLRDSFARGSSAALSGLADALSASDWATVARHAHTLKGSCLSLGAAEAAALAKDLEARAKTEDPTGAAEALVGLEIAVEDVRAELEEAAGRAARA
jgi:CheY-like chemotaxis protein/HPt (histidine-containing phosphotransfer) domain-containing protein